MNDMIPLSALQRHYQRFLNKCVARDDTTGRLLSRHRDLLRVVLLIYSGLACDLPRRTEWYSYYGNFLSVRHKNTPRSSGQGVGGVEYRCRGSRQG